MPRNLHALSIWLASGATAGLSSSKALSKTLLALLALVVGCSPQQEPADAPADAHRLVDLKLLVVDDPALSRAIGELRAEWKARTGSSVAIMQTTSDELLAGESPSVDAIIYPSGQLGALAARQWIAPLPEDYSANRELDWSDTFELSQIAETNWGKAPLAVPLGSPVLVLYYRSDLLERVRKRPPATWEEYRELAEILGKRENLGDAAPRADAPWWGAAEPLAAGHAAGTFLARAAAYAKHRDQHSSLFHVETMEPLVAGPPFVRALEELVAAAKLFPPSAAELDPDAVRREFLAGGVALAISWPGRPGASGRAAAVAHPPTGFAELPGSDAVYNVNQKTWDKRRADESLRVPLLGLSGRLGSVVRTSAEPLPAFQLLAWLAGREWGTRVSSASPATTLYRRSQMKAPQPWLDSLTDAKAAEEYATSVRDAESHLVYLFAPRIPGRARYLASLDAAVRAAAAGEKPAADALNAAAAEWRRITDELGVDAQRLAYRQSLGLAP